MTKENQQNKSDFCAFTVKGNSFLENIKLTVGIIGHRPDHSSAVVTNRYLAVVSTINRSSKISSKVVNALELTTEEKKGVHIAHIDLYLPNTIRIKNISVQVIEKIENVNCDCIIGMDVLACGDCSLSSNGKKTMFSFRVPSFGAEDFVETHRKLHKKKTAITMAARNQPCPCGSGMKYKSCCGKIF